VRNSGYSWLFLVVLVIPGFERMWRINAGFTEGLERKSEEKREETVRIVEKRGE